MTWRYIGKPLETADMTVGAVPTVYQGFTVSGSRNKLLKKVIASVIAHNPTFTALVMELWGGVSTPTALVATSTTSKVRADLLAGSDNYGLSFAGFEFTPVPLRSGATYYLALKATGYTYAELTHLGWRHAWPSPQFTSGITQNQAKAATYPLEVMLLTADL